MHQPLLAKKGHSATVTSLIPPYKVWMLEDRLSCDRLCQHLLHKSQATRRDLQAIHCCQVLEHLSKLKDVWLYGVASIIQRVFSPKGQSQITHLWISFQLKAAQRPTCLKAADQRRLPASSINDWQNLSSKKEAGQKSKWPAALISLLSPDRLQMALVFPRERLASVHLHGTEMRGVDSSKGRQMPTIISAPQLQCGCRVRELDAELSMILLQNSKTAMIFRLGVSYHLVPKAIKKLIFCWP